MSKQVVTIGYLKSFVSGAGITVTATTSQTDTYCPKYSELTGGSLVKLYNESTYSTDNTNGILIDTYSVGDSKNSYSNTQLVVRADLKVVSTELTGVTVNKSPTSNVNGSGGSVTISVTGKFKTTTKEETETQLRMGGWQYLDGTAQGENPEDVVPNADKNAWYYGSALWFKEGGTAILTVNGSDENASYTVNKDSTITVTADSIGGDGRFALGKDEKYGTILYSKTDDNIRFFMAMI